MFLWAKKFNESSVLTKNAVIALIIWAAPVIIMTFYCYARLNFTEVGNKHAKFQEKQISK